MKDIATDEIYSEMLVLQKIINAELKFLYEKNKSAGREYLSEVLVSEVENIVDRLNENGGSFGRNDYRGDINFENSEQIYSNGKEMGVGVILHFRGFSVQVYWEGADKYEKH
jgi:hypothetical protein